MDDVILARETIFIHFLPIPHGRGKMNENCQWLLKIMYSFQLCPYQHFLC